jgi:Leucine-rich repeat (LRR) protein
MVKWKVYISSTFKDLKDFRAEIISLFQNQLQNSFELSEIMERMFDDGTYTPFVDDCVKAVVESDIYIIILGNKTGSFPPDEERTYTEIELDTALANHKRVFCLHLEKFDENQIDNKAKHDALLNKFNGRPIHTFKEITDLKNALYEFLIQFAHQSPVNAKNPYKGLASFSIDDGDYFFGREAELESCLKKIVTADGNFFLSVIGNSGTGKSSFVQAGILFRLKHRPELGYNERLLVIVTPGNTPFTNLKYQLQLQGMSTDAVLNGNSGSTDLIIYFDQFEEVITQCHSPEAQAEVTQLFEFLDALAEHPHGDSKVLVICSFRSDFLSQLANFDFIKSKQYLFPISSLDYKVHASNWEESMSAIISQPARKNGVLIEPELVDQLLNQLKDVEGSLPILQFTLERIWTKDTIADRRISTSEYSTLSEGRGIGGIIQTHAEKVIKTITRDGRDKTRETILKSIFVNLVEVNENRNDVKRTVKRAELFAILKDQPKELVTEVYEALLSEQGRLLNESAETDETINVSIIHEELIRKWERLRAWIDERREALEHKKRITLDIAAYTKGEDGLYGKSQLRKAKQWKANNPDLATEEINLFFEKAKQKNNLKLYKQSGVTVLAVGLITCVIFLWVQPFIQKRDFVKQVSDNIDLYKRVQAAGGIDELSSLNIIQGKGNYAILNGNLKHLGNLKAIKITEVNNLEDLSIFDNIKNPSGIQSLTLSDNPNLQSLAGLERLTNLQSLTLSDNPNLQSLAVPEELKNLQSLTVSGNYDLPGQNVMVARPQRPLAGLEQLTNLQSLSISHNFYLQNLAGLEQLTNLQSLTLSDNPNLQSLAGLEQLTNLQSLTLSGNEYLYDLAVPEELKNLQSLTLSGRLRIADLKRLTNLQSLTLSGNEYLDNLYELAGLEQVTNLQSLTLSGNYNLQNMVEKESPPLISLERLTNLQSLTVSGNEYLYNLYELAGLERLTKLQSLTLSDNPNLHSLAGLERLTKLQSLNVSDNEKLQTSAVPEELKNLQSLTVSGNEYLYDLAGLEQLTNLQSLTLSDNPNLHSLAGLERLTKLQSLNVSDNETLENLAGLERLTALDSLTISIDTNIDFDIIRQHNPGIVIHIVE